MKGKHHVVIETARLKYEFDIKRNITVLKGDSATGKTTLVGLLQAFSVRGEKSGVSVTSDVPCRVYSGDAESWRTMIGELSACILFIDEDYSFIASRDFAELIRGTEHYYVLITRRDLPNLPYSINEIYGIRTSGKYHFPQKIYNEFYRIYSEEYTSRVQSPVLITEDSKAGFQFFSKVCGETVCISAGGNSNIFQAIRKAKQSENLVIIADGAAFGAFIANVLAASEIRSNIMLYFPESFEWMILKSGIIREKDISDVLESPEVYIESSRYFSWEQFFTEYLKTITSNNAKEKYDKSAILPFYTGKHNAEKILGVMPEEISRVLR